MKRFLFGLILFPTAVFAAWQPPIGIPYPSFGIEEASPASPSPWTSPQSGWYFVCPTCSGATDTSNPNGYAGRPRLTIPSPLAARVAVGVARVGGA